MKQGNILTFDEAKKAASHSRSFAVPSDNQRKRSAPVKRTSASVKQTSKSSLDFSRNTSLRSTTSKPLTKQTIKNVPSKSSRRLSQDLSLPHPRHASQNSGRIPRVSPTEKHVKSSGRVSHNSGKIPKISKFSELKKSASKRKAEKQFSQQFERSPSDASRTGPRAAVYRTEMGRQHKKMTKMQGSTRVGTFGFFSKFSFVGFDVKRSPKLIGVTMVVIFLVLSSAFLYPTAKQHYLTQRGYDQAQAEYAALDSRNNEIQAQVDKLSSDEGIEDKARQEFGWVKEGERAITVQGLGSDAQHEIAYKKSIPSGSVEAPSSWYTPLLDAVFGLE